MSGLSEAEVESMVAGLALDIEGKSGDNLRAAVEAIVAPYRDALTRVEALHQPRRFDTMRDGVHFGQTEFPDLCTGCWRVPWPCPTTLALRSDAHTEQKGAGE